MIYQVDHTKKECTINQMKEEHMYLAMMSLEELKECHHDFHISSKTMHECEQTLTSHQNIIIPHQHYYYGYIHLINARNIFMKQDALTFFIFKNLFLVVVIDDEDNHIQNIFETSCDYVLQRGVSITRLVFYFLTELFARDGYYIEELQEMIEELECMDEESKQFSSSMKRLAKELLMLRNYYSHLVYIGEELEMNYHNIFSKDDMRYFEIYTRRIERFVSDVQMLRDLLNQISHEHESKLNYELNKTMQFFTAIATIFMPLTLMTGWYGMNFKSMPELSSPYGYMVFIAISLVVVGGLVYWFKKKKFFK